MSNEETDRWLTVAEASHVTGVSERTLRRRVSEGRIESKLEGRRRLVFVTDDMIPHEAATGTPTLIDQLRRENEYLRGQIEQKDEQISELHQLLMAAETRSQQLLEDRRPFWRRWFKRGDRSE
jgi:excisionase family DNA binding protein